MMAENEPTEVESTDDDPVASSGGGIVGKLKVFGFIAIVVIGECAFAYPFLGDAESNRDTLITQEQEETAEEKVAEEERVEVLFGDFDVTVFQPISNTTLRVNFILVGSVFEDDQSTVEDLIVKNRHRFNQMVLVTVRSSEITDLIDPALGLLKRKILEKSNRLFGKPVVQAVIFSQFSYFEQ